MVRVMGELRTHKDPALRKEAIDNFILLLEDRTILVGSCFSFDFFFVAKVRTVCANDHTVIQICTTISRYGTEELKRKATLILSMLSSAAASASAAAAARAI